ncbi:immunity protein YezG family protein [Luteolibacter sp. Populi]|uniref:immunity protein YezG family protein n=1 Tax=Luteolibacter sp. Populi TaxID=3230487 RepID=UPI003465582D
MNKQPEDFYEPIGQALADTVGKPFIAAWIRVEIRDSTSAVSVFYRASDGEYYYADRSEELDEFIYRHWEMAADQGENWDEMTFRLESSGEFHVGFEYDIPMEMFLDEEKRDEWLQKNLGEVKVNYPPGVDRHNSP